MPKDEFVQNLRLAASTVAPSVHTDSEQLSARQISRRLARAALWMTPKAVEGYDPEDFRDLPKDQQEDLRNAVGEFKPLASSVPPDEPATDEQYKRGLELFTRIVSLVREPILAEWKDSVERIVAETEAWAVKHNWICRREKKTVSERLLDSYELSQLMIHADGSFIVLNPVARFVPGALGVVDLTLVPSYHFLSIPRKKDGWHLQMDPGRKGGLPVSKDWNENSFVEAVTWLRQRA
jgi:hypothetical protein